jgi:pimeloyl-ACP methyl ester carboxylesterase
MPYYDQKSLPFSSPFGPSFPSVVSRLDAILAPAVAAGSPITLVGHDWGAYISSRFVAQHPSVVDKLVLLDVSTSLDPASVPLIVMYQLTSVLSFLLGLVPIVGRFIGLLPIVLYPWKTIGPTPSEWNMPRDKMEVRPFMCYP